MQNTKLIILLLLFSKHHFAFGSYPSEDYIRKAALKVFELDTNANEKDIRGAYLRMALKCHPDKDNTPKANEIFKKSSSAYECLTDPTKCKAFADTYLRDASQEPVVKKAPSPEDYSITIGEIILGMIDSVFKDHGFSMDLFNVLNNDKSIFIQQYDQKKWNENVVNILKTIVVAFDVIPEFKTAKLEKRRDVATKLKQFADQEHTIYKNEKKIAPGIAEILKKIDAYLATLDKEAQAEAQQRKTDIERNRQAQQAEAQQRKLEAERGEQRRIEQIRNSRTVSNAAKKNTTLPSYRESSRIEQSQFFQKNQLSESLSNFVKSLKNLTETLKTKRAW